MRATLTWINAGTCPAANIQSALHCRRRSRERFETTPRPALADVSDYLTMQFASWGNDS